MKLIKCFSCLVFLLVAIFVASIVFTDENKKNNEKKEAKELKIVIEKIEGTVDVKLDKDSKWTKAKEKMELKVQSKVSTGFNSKATINFGDRGILELTSLTYLEVHEFLEDPEAVRASLKINIGEVKVEVKHGDVKADFKVKTPNITAAVKGTKFSMRSESDKGDSIRMNQGRVFAYDRKGYSVYLVKDDVTRSGSLLRPYEGELLDLLVSYSPTGLFSAEKEYIKFMGELSAYIQTDFLSDELDPSGDSESVKIEEQINEMIREFERRYPEY